MNDLDPMLREAMTRVRGPIDARPSLSDVRRRARRQSRRRMAVTASVVACTGVATAALVVRRDSTGHSAASPSGPDASEVAASTFPPGGDVTTTSAYALSQATIDAQLVWQALLNARFDPSGVALLAAPPDQETAQTMPTPELFGCTVDACRALYTYVAWHEIGRILGFGDVIEMQAANPNIDFSLPPVEGDVLQTPSSTQTVPPDANGNQTPTTISIFEGIILIDGGAPAGAMEDAYQRLPGYDRTIVPGTGKQIAQTEVMPIGANDAMASSIAALVGVGGLDTWDSSFIASPIQGMVAVIVGPDYWDLVQNASSPSTTTSTSTTIVP